MGRRFPPPTDESFVDFKDEGGIVATKELSPEQWETCLEHFARNAGKWFCRVYEEQVPYLLELQAKEEKERKKQKERAAHTL